MPELLSETTSFCTKCGQHHPARYEREGDDVWYTIPCPRQEQRTRVSCDARLFQSIRQRAGFVPGQQPAFALQRPFCFLEITDACNMRCPVCYAEAGPEGHWHMSLEQVRARGRQIAEGGGRWVSLTGGEASVHPQIIEIVRVLRKEFRLRPLLLTNGLRLAEEPGFAAELRRAGLAKVQLQMDTLRPETYRLLRGRDDVSEKHRAIAAVRSAAGLRLGLVCTVCQWNLSEIGDMVKLATSLAPTLNSLIIQSVCPVGRLPDGIDFLDRETLINALVSQASIRGLDHDQFWPTPAIPAWHMAVHPDCPANLHLLVDRGVARPIGAAVDLRSFCASMGRGTGHGPLASLRPLWHLVCAAKPGSRVGVLRNIYGMATGRGSRGAIWITVGGYMHPATRDDERIARCPTCSANSDGIVGMCERSCGGQNTVARHSP